MTSVTEADGKTWEFIGIKSKNSREWYLLHLANMYNKMTTVSFYDTLGTEASQYICDQTQLKTIACTSDLVESLAKMKSSEDDPEGKMKNLQNIIALDGFTQEGIDMAKKVGINPITLEFVEEAGKGYMDMWEEKSAERDDYLMICYTSGTSGMPKGVKVTQKMMT